MENIFVARYKQNGINKSIAFNKASFDEDKARVWLKNNDIQNFFFFFEPQAPTPFGENGMMFKGDVGFEITMETLMPHIDSGKEIVLDTPGGDLWEALAIYDTFKIRNLNNSIGVVGTCASAGTIILLATENRWISENSRGLIHNPWTWVEGDDQELRKTADYIEKEKLNIANIYSKVSGKSVEDILILMKKEILLNADEMIAYNFAKSKTNKFDNSDNSQKPKEDMANDKNKTNDEIKNEIGGIRKILNSLSNLISGVKNLILQDVNGVELDFGDEIETQEQIEEGTTATVDGAPASGKFTMADGTIYTFEAGTITEITAPAGDDDSEEMANLKAENEALKTENETLKADVENSKTDLKAVNSKYLEQMTQVQNKLDALEGQFTDDKPKPNTPSSKGDDTKKKFSYKSKNK